VQFGKSQANIADFTEPLHVVAMASMLFFTILGLDNPDGNITASYVAVTFAGT
jgi:hypothetical protein